MYVGLAQVGAGVVAFAIVSVGMGLGFTFYSGAMEAWLVDALAATGYRGLLDRVFARGQQITGAAMLVGTVGGGLLGQINLSLPYVVRSMLLLPCSSSPTSSCTTSASSRETRHRRRAPGRDREERQAGVEFGWRQRTLRLLMLAVGRAARVLLWGFYASQPYLLELLDSDAIWIAGLRRCGGRARNDRRQPGRRASPRATAAGARRCCSIAAAVQTVAAITMGLASSFWVALPALFLVMGAMGVTSPVRSAYLHQVVPTEQRATVVSFDSMVSNVGGIGGQIGLGALGEARSVGSAFVVGGRRDGRCAAAPRAAAPARRCAGRHRR